MLAEHFDSSITILTLVDDVGADSQSYDTTVVSLKCLIQPLDDSFDEDIAGSYGKDFLMFSGSTTIKQGDRVFDGTDYFMVRGVESYSFNGLEHIETRIRKLKE